MVGGRVVEGCGFEPVGLGEGFAGGSAGRGVGGTGTDAVAEAVPPDGLGRVVVADGCGRAVAVAAVAGAGAVGVPGAAAALWEGGPVCAEAGSTAPSELPPASRTVASPQTTSPAADAARTLPRPPCRRAERPAERPDVRRGGADSGDGASSAGTG
ncbi:hypothetical protein SAMN06272789_6505 [Streptomyces sp. 1331.2]|nr:hypothetical protein SAMN06272789_6505 [Streptomyces sp. 1331.2]